MISRDHITTQSHATDVHLQKHFQKHSPERISTWRILCLSTLLLQGCASDPANSRREQGTLIGAVSGAVIGQQIHQDRGAIVGAAIGAIAGNAVGQYQDEQQRELENSLRREQAAKTVEIQRLQDDILRVSLSSEASFEIDKADIQPAFYRSLDRLAQSIARYDKTILHVLGHTDSTGNDDYNHALSIRRAQTVAQYLMLKGISSSRLRIEGRGESEPRVDNSTKELRQLNRRVEIFIKPIIEGDEERALSSP